MLGDFGSPAAESALRRRFATWCSKWYGHESELDPAHPSLIAADRRSEGLLGVNLARAIATGQSWLIDPNGLQELARMTKHEEIRDELERDMNPWKIMPLTIRVQDSPLGDNFRADVAQYYSWSMDILKQKLAQFPKGTQFILSCPEPDSPEMQKLLEELRGFLTTHRMLVSDQILAE
jgi:hypothetical protein